MRPQPVCWGCKMHVCLCVAAQHQNLGGSDAKVATAGMLDAHLRTVPLPPVRTAPAIFLSFSTSMTPSAGTGRALRLAAAVKARARWLEARSPTHNARTFPKVHQVSPRPRKAHYTSNLSVRGVVSSCARIDECPNGWCVHRPRLDKR